MPELPEVEVVCRSLAPLVVSQRLRSVWTSGKALRSFSGEAGCLSPLVGQRLLGVSRRAKFLVFQFEAHLLLLHLGMSGVADWSARVSSATVDQAVDSHPPHCHLVLEFERGLLRLVDPRRFGDVRLVSGITLDAHLLGGSSGLEPLSEGFTGERLHDSARGVRQAVKVWLMRGDPVVGVGNIYASEALFRAGIHPSRAAGRISRSRFDRLAAEIRSVLSEAIEAGGSTLRDFRGVSGEAGRYGGAHQVYGREGLACLRCGSSVRRIVQAQRATYFCSTCQR